MKIAPAQVSASYVIKPEFERSAVVPRGPFPSSDMPERDPATAPTEPPPPPLVVVLDEFEDEGDPAPDEAEKHE